MGDGVDSGEFFEWVPPLVTHTTTVRDSIGWFYTHFIVIIALIVMLDKPVAPFAQQLSR